ncbi:MAG: hypothetical protein D6731_23290 [Planctomycetota bacterium]|nr:MAG: hypothetical protein D6731_23290 [Planctomycetota bacterium]
MTLAPGKALDPAALRKAAQDTGFGVEWAELEVDGVLTERETPAGRVLALRLEDRDQTVLLLPGDGTETAQGLARLARHLGEPTLFRVRGRLREHPSGLPAMTVERYQRVEPPSR